MKVAIVYAATSIRAQRFKNMLEEEKINVKLVQRKNKFGYASIFTKILKYRPDVVHILNGPDLINLPSITASKFVGARIIYDMRSNTVDNIYGKFGKGFWGTTLGLFSKIFQKYAFLTADSFILPQVTRVKAREREIGKKVTLIPQAVDAKLFINAKPLKKDGKVLLFLGSLSKKEGVDTIIKAFWQMKMEDIQLWILGDGYNREHLEMLAKANKRVRFFGRIPHEKVPKYIKTADVCLVPLKKNKQTKYTSHTTVLKLGEFMAVGKPVLSSDAGSMNLAKKYGVVLARAGDAKDFAKKMEMQLNKPKNTKFPDELKWENVKKKYLSVLNNLETN